MLLKRFESGQPFTYAFTKQSAVSACLRAVCARDPSRPPQPVTYEDKTVQCCINEVQRLMLPAMQATHSSDLPDWITVDAIRQSNLLIPLAV
jgi:hypothetical protein